MIAVLRSLVAQEEITSAHYLAFSLTENQSLQFFLRSKKLRKVIKNLLQNSTESLKQCVKNSFEQIEKRKTYVVLIH